MGHDMPPERALLRLQQLAREERAAAEAGDAEALCRIAKLFPPAMEALNGARLSDIAGLRAAMADILSANAAAETCVSERMAAVSERLRAIHAVRRAMRAYARCNTASPSRLNDRG
jgi:hypothetical protein